MKTKKVIAVLAGAALATGLVVGMTACKNDDSPKSLGTATLSIADYATEYKPVSYSQEGYKSIKTLFSAEISDIVASNNTFKIYVNNGKYNVCNLLLGTDVLSGLTTQPQIQTLSIYGGGGSLYVITVTDSQSKTAYYLADGTQLLASDNYYGVSASQASAYVGTSTEKSDILCVAGITSAETPTLKYYEIITDEQTGDKSYIAINASDIKLYGSDYNKGEIIDSLLNPVYDSTAKKPVEGELKDYSVKYEGNTWSYYKNGEKTGSVDFKDKTPLGYVDNNLYYYSILPVDSNATSGYNYVIMDDGFTFKCDYSLYKYDITANKVTELNYDVVILSLKSMYNYTTKTYDAAYINGYEMVDGIAYYYYGEFNYVTDKNLNVAFDLSGYGLGNSLPTLYDLGNDMYYAVDSDVNVIFDKDAKIVNDLGWYGDRYLGDGLVAVSTGSIIGFTDLSGKVVIEPKYVSASGTLVFYDGIAHVMEANVTGEAKELLIKNDGTVALDITAIENSSTDTQDKEVYVGNGYYTVTTTNTADNTSTQAFYAMDGTLLKSFSLGEYDYITTQTLSDGSLLLTVPKNDSGVTTYEYYKLVK